MFLRKFSLTDIILILINLVPLYGVWFENWNPVQAFIVYCLETVIIGVLNIFKLVLAAVFYREPVSGARSSSASALFIVIFFTIHYGFFVFVQTQMFMGVTNIGSSSLFHNYREMIEILGPEGYMLLGIFAAYYTMEMITGFIVKGKFRETPLLVIMFQPYGRIFVQQLIVIVGSMFLALSLPKFFMLLFVITKTAADLFINRAISDKMAGTSAKRKLSSE